MTETAAESGLGRVHSHLDAMGLGAFSLYKEPCFGRRLASRMRACRVADHDGYADRLDRDPAERAKLAAALSIGVTGFFRNPETWRRLAAALDRRAPTHAFEAWSAGCASGEEAYGVGLLLQRISGSDTGLDWRVLGTDLDPRAIAAARSAVYPAAVRSLIEAAIGVRPDGSPGEPYVPAPSIRDRITFRRADLLVPVPSDRFDLVLCRNVLIYFGAEGQARVLANLVRSLRPGGLLVLGKAESLGVGDGHGLDVVDRSERIYRRPR